MLSFWTYLLFGSVKDSSPGLEPEDHMERSWLVDKAGVRGRQDNFPHLHPKMLERLPPDCFAIATTSRGLIGTK